MRPVKEGQTGVEELVGTDKPFLRIKGHLGGVLHGDRVESVSDPALNAGGEIVKQVAPGEIDLKVDEVRDQLDKAIGTEW